MGGGLSRLFGDVYELQLGCSQIQRMPRPNLESDPRFRIRRRLVASTVLPVLELLIRC